MEARIHGSRRLVRMALICGAVATAVVASAACSEESASDKKSSEGGPSIGAVANDPQIHRPVDATPSPDGKDVYFIASAKAPDENGIGTVAQAAIYKVSAAGGPATKLFQGDPLVEPTSITISPNGQTLFIADVAAETSADRSDGRVWTLGVGGGTPAPLAGTDGLAPTGLEIMGDSLYITGTKDKKTGLYKSGLTGGNVGEVATGDAFSDPGGVAVAKNGTAFVVDTGSVLHGAAMASVVKVTADGKTSVLVEGLSVGAPAGIAITLDEKTLFVSGFDTAAGTDVVYTVDVASGEFGLFTDKIADFRDSAGLHRAHDVDVFAWADGHANATGTVYVLRGQGQ